MGDVLPGPNIPPSRASPLAMHDPSPARSGTRRPAETRAMIPFPTERLDAILARHDIVTAQLASGEGEPDTVVQLSRELSDLDPVVAAIRSLSGGPGRTSRASRR